MSGLLDHAPLETRVAWVKEGLFERIEVDGVQQQAVSRLRRRPIRMLTGSNQ
jgi:hypothetical protein